MATAINDYLKVGGGYKPAYDSTGLLVNYGSGSSASGYNKPITDSSGLVTGYTTNASQKGNTITKAPDNVFDPLTGKNASGRTRGEQAAYDFQQNTAKVATVKSQPIADAAAATLGQVKDVGATAVKSLNDYLQEAKQLQAQSLDAVNADAKTYKELPAKLDAELSDTVKQFATRTTDLSNQYGALNDKQAQTNQQDIARLDELNNQYDANARAVAAQSVAAAQRRNNLTQSVSGTPTSGGGYWDQLTAKTNSEIMLPVEQQISSNRIGQLTNYITPLQQQQYAQQLAKITGFDYPVASALANMGVTQARDVAQLSQQLAGRTVDEQIRLLTSMGLPIEMATRVMQSLPSALSTLSAIDQNNTFYGLTQDYQQPLAGPLPTYTPPAPPTVSNTNQFPNNYMNSAAAPVTTSSNPSLPTNVNPGASLPSGWSRYTGPDGYSRLVPPAGWTGVGPGNSNVDNIGWDYRDEAIPQYPNDYSLN